MCQLCEIEPVYEFTNKRKVCRKCYIKWFNKKILYAIRKFSMIKKGDIIKLSKKKDFRNVVLSEVLKNYSSKYYAEITFHEKGKKYIKIALPDTTDLIAEKIIKEVMKGNITNLKKIYPVYKKNIRPLFLFLDKEVLLYARLNGLKYSKKDLNKERKVKVKKDEISNFIDKLEEKHPEIKRAIVNNYVDIFKDY